MLKKEKYSHLLGWIPSSQFSELAHLEVCLFRR